VTHSGRAAYPVLDVVFCSGLNVFYRAGVLATCMLCIPASRFMAPSPRASSVIGMAVQGEYLL